MTNGALFANSLLSSLGIVHGQAFSIICSPGKVLLKVNVALQDEPLTYALPAAFGDSLFSLFEIDLTDVKSVVFSYSIEEVPSVTISKLITKDFPIDLSDINIEPLSSNNRPISLSDFSEQQDYMPK